MRKSNDLTRVTQLNKQRALRDWSLVSGGYADEASTLALIERALVQPRPDNLAPHSTALDLTDRWRSELGRAYAAQSQKTQAALAKVERWRDLAARKTGQDEVMSINMRHERQKLRVLAERRTVEQKLEEMIIQTWRSDQKSGL